MDILPRRVVHIIVEVDKIDLKQRKEIIMKLTSSNFRLDFHYLGMLYFSNLSNLPPTERATE